MPIQTFPSFGRLNITKAPASPVFSAKPQNHISQPQAPNPEPHFGASRGLRRAGGITALAAGLSLLPAALGIGIGTASASTGTTQDGRVCIADDSVNSATDLPELRKDSPVLGHTQNVVDLCNHPLLSDATRAKLERQLAAFNAGNKGQMAVVVIPRTDQQEINTLAVDLGNQMGIGDDEKDNGVIAVANAGAIRSGANSSRLSVEPGAGLHSSLNQDAIMDILINEALPSLQQGNTDEAVSRTVDAITQRVNNMDTPAAGDSTAAPGDDIDWGTVGIVALSILGGLLALGGTGIAASRLLEWKRRMDEDVDVVRYPLTQMQSGYKLNRSNVHSIETMRALLAPSLKQTHPEPLLDALSLVRKAVYRNGQQQGEVRPLLIQQGLQHGDAEVRSYAMRVLAKEGVRRDLFDPLMNQLGVEMNPKAFDEMESPLTDLVTAKDLPRFEEGLNSDNGRMRQLSIRVLSRSEFFRNETLQTFFTRLEKETDPEIIGNLRGAILTHSKEERFANLFLEKLDSKNTEVKRTAIQALSAMRSGKYFDQLLAQFKANQEKSLDAPLSEALVASVQAGHLPKLFDALKGDARMQQLGLTLLASLKNDRAVAPLFEYLESGNDQSKPQAADVLVASVSPRMHAQLGEKLSSTNESVQGAAVRGIGQLAQASDLPRLFELMEGIQSKSMAQLLNTAISRCGSKPEAFNTLADALQHNDNFDVKIAAANMLAHHDGQGLGTLFDGLEAGHHWPEDVKDAIRVGIKHLGQKEGALPFLLEKVSSPKTLVQEAAAGAASAQIASWTQRHNYDQPKVMENLKQLSKHGHPQIRQTAEKVWEQLVTAKVKSVSNVSSNDVSSSSTYQNNRDALEKTMKQALDPRVKTAASEAIDELDRLRKKKVAAAHRSSSRSSSRSRSHGGGGYGYGGSDGGYGGGGGGGYAGGSFDGGGGGI